MSEMVLSRSLALTTWLLVSLLRGISLDRTRVILKVSCGYIIFELTFTILLAVNFNTFDFHDEVNNKHVDVQANHRTVVREIGAASAVLLKNEKNALPLKKPRRIALIGNDAGPALRGPNGFLDRAGNDGILGMGWGSGTAQFPYLISPLEGIQARARQDNAIITWWLDNTDVASAANAALNQDVAVCTFPALCLHHYANQVDPSWYLLTQTLVKLVVLLTGTRGTARTLPCGKTVKALSLLSPTAIRTPL